MTTDPGDLVIDPTCGSGTTAYVAEQWGRRWITMDVSRVPLALARQRLLTATFPYFELKEEARGPAGGFVYRRKQNNRGEEIGGIVPYITKGSVAGDEPAKETVLVDRPEENGRLTRVSGPFTFEATIPTPMDWETETVILSDATSQGSRRTQESEESRQATGDPSLASRREPGRPGDPLRVTGAGVLDATDHTAFTDRMLEVLRKSPVLHLGGGKTVTLHNIRPPAKTLSLSAEALVDATAAGQSPSIMDAVDEAEEQSGLKLPLSRKPVAIVFGPENGAVAERQVFEAAKEASAKGYTVLYVIGFAIQANARELIESCEDVVGVPAAYVQATPDLMMGDLLKNMRSSQIFSVCGLPEIAPHINAR